MPAKSNISPNPAAPGPIMALPPGPAITFDDIRACGYSLQHDRDTIVEAHYKYIIPWMERNLADADPDFYLTICLYSFNVCGGRCFSDEAEYSRWFSSIYPLIQQKVWQVRQALSIPPASRPSTKREGPPYKIGFLLSPSTAATIHMMEICNYLAQNDDQFEVHIIHLSPSPEAFKNYPAAPQAHKHFVYVDWSMEKSFTGSLKELRKKTDEIGLEIVLTGFTPAITAVMTAMDLAPIQLFFSHFLHAPMLRLGCKYQMTYGSPAVTEQQFGDEPYLVIPSAIKHNSLQERPTLAELTQIREKYAPHHQIILGALGRTAKVGQPEFLKAVAEILINNPGTVFLYTSNENLDPVAAFFEAEGLSARVRNVGWVDLDQFIPLVDIFLDTFPMAGGITLLTCLAHGKPVVSLATPYSYFGRDLEPIIGDIGRRRRIGLYRDNDHLNHLFWDNSKYQSLIGLICDHRESIVIRDREAYIKTSGRLIGDLSFRDQIGSLARALYENLYSDTELMGATFAGHLREIIHEEIITEQKMDSKNNFGYNCQPDAIIAPSSIGRCVNKCRFCLQSHPDFYFAKHPLEMVYADDEIFTKVLSELPDTVQGVSVTPYTETVLSSNILTRIREAVARGHKVAFETSNVVYKEDFYKQALEMGLSRILVSVNAPTRELYRQTHGRDNFDRVIENMEKLIDLRNRCSPSTQIHIHIMLFKEFLDAYPAFYEQWKDKVDSIYLQGLCNWGHDKWLHYDFRAHGLMPVTLQEVRRVPCPFIFATLLLHPDGNYYTCGMAYRQYIRGKPLGCLGNARHITAMEAWNRLTYYRNQHLQGRWDELECCADCNAWLTWILHVEHPEFEGEALKIKVREQVLDAAD